MPDNSQQHTGTGDSHCPDCGVIAGARHTAMCGARDSGQEIWPGYCGAPILALQIGELRGQLDRVLDRLAALEAATPEARQLAYRVDPDATDVAACGSYHDDRPNPVGADRHGETCQCPYCPGEPEKPRQGECPCGSSYTPDGECPGSWHGCSWHNEGPEPDDYDPGPECDDQGGMSEHRFTVVDGEQPS